MNRRHTWAPCLLDRQVRPRPSRHLTAAAAVLGPVASLVRPARRVRCRTGGVEGSRRVRNHSGTPGATGVPRYRRL